MATEYLGTVNKGYVFTFVVDASTYTYAYYDVIRNSDRVVVSSDVALAAVGAGYRANLKYADLDTSDAAYYAGDKYTVVVKTHTGTSPTNWEAHEFDVIYDPSMYAPTIFLGEAIKGNTLKFAVRSNGMTWFDVYRVSTDALVLSNQRITPYVNGYGYELAHGSIATAGFAVDEDYTVIMKDRSGASPMWFAMLSFRVVSDVPARLNHLRNDVENVLFPRTKRLLSYHGENQMIDLVEVDAANNMISMRVRTFDDRASALAATPDLPDVSGLEPGEVSRLTVTQTYSLPRCVRDSHVATTSDSDPDDLSVTDNQATGAVDAPGNEDGWPQ